jgi:tetratricopeptide (TPR) repeat protein
MRIKLFAVVLLASLCTVANSQTPTPQPSPRPTAPQTRPQQSGFDLTEAGVRIQADPRLIVVMAALEAAGFDPTPKGQEPSPFRVQVRREQSELDSDLKLRMRTFFDRTNREMVNATPAEQAARYVSLAYALGPAPNFEAPVRTVDLPGSLLEVLDFAPLVREFYHKSGIDERLPEYQRKYQAEGDRLRPATIEMVRSVLAYLNAKPVTTVIESVQVKSPGTGASKKKDAPTYTSRRERERRFFIVPDLLAAPGAINLRVIADDYYVVTPFDTNPASSEMRRAYVQYIVDPIVLRFNRDVAARRAQIRPLLDERIAAGGEVSPDVFLAVVRSLVAATEVRMDELARRATLSQAARQKIEATTDTKARESIALELKTQHAAVADESIAQLSDAYERGAVLAFYFAEQLKGIETSGFDITNFFADMMASFDQAREAKRLTENAEARKRAVDARKLRQAQRLVSASESESPEAMRRSQLIKSMSAVDDLLQVKNYSEAEVRLRALMQEYQGEPRIFFALGQAASLSAEDATDENVQGERLQRALTHYSNAIRAADPESDKALTQRAYAAIGRILEFFENTPEALKAFDAAIKLGPIDRNAFDEAVKGKARVTQPK